MVQPFRSGCFITVLAYREEKLVAEPDERSNSRGGFHGPSPAAPLVELDKTPTCSFFSLFLLQNRSTPAYLLKQDYTINHMRRHTLSLKQPR